MGQGGPAADAGDRLTEPAGAAPLPAFGALASQSAYFSLGGVAQKAVGLLLIPVITRALSTSEFGRLEVLSTLVSALTSTATLGLDTVVTRRWVDSSADERSRLFAAWAAISVLLGGAMVLAAGLWGGPLSEALFDTRAYAWPVRLVGLCAAANLLSVVGLTALRNQGRARTYAIVAVLTVVTNGALAGTLASVRGDAAAVLLGLTLATTLGAVLALAATRSLVLRPPAPGTAGMLLRRTMPLVPGLALTWGGDFAGRFVLLDQAGPTEVGFFSIAIRFSTIGLILHSGFLLAWHPRAYELATRSGGRERIGADAMSMAVILSLLTVALAALGPELLLLLAGHRYDDALGAVGVGLLVPLATLVFTIAALPLATANRLRRLGVATAVAATSALAATVALAGPWGAAGAMVALVAGQLVGALVARRLVADALDRPAYPRRRWIGLAAAAMAVTLAVTQPDPALPLAVRLAVLAAYAGLVLACEPTLVRSGVQRLVALARPQRR